MVTYMPSQRGSFSLLVCPDLLLLPGVITLSQFEPWVRSKFQGGLWLDMVLAWPSKMQQCSPASRIHFWGCLPASRNRAYVYCRQPRCDAQY